MAASAFSLATVVLPIAYCPYTWELLGELGGGRVESVRVAPAPGVAVYYMLADM